MGYVTFQGKIFPGTDRSGKDISTASIDLRHSWKSQTVVPVSFTGSFKWYLFACSIQIFGKMWGQHWMWKAVNSSFPCHPSTNITAQQHKSCIFFKALWKLQIPSYCFVKRHRSSNPVFRSLLVMILFSSFLFILPDLLCWVWWGFRAQLTIPDSHRWTEQGWKATKTSLETFYSSREKAAADFSAYSKVSSNHPIKNIRSWTCKTGPTKFPKSLRGLSL